MSLRTLLAYNFASRFSASDGIYKGSHSTSKWFMNWQRSKITCRTCQNFKWTMNFLFVINDEIYVKVALCVQKCACLDAYTHQCTFMPGDYTQHIHIYTQIHMHIYFYITTYSLFLEMHYIILASPDICTYMNRCTSKSTLPCTLSF